MKQINYFPQLSSVYSKWDLKKKQEFKENDWIFSHFLKKINSHTWKTAYFRKLRLLPLIWIRANYKIIDFCIQLGPSIIFMSIYAHFFLEKKWKCDQSLNFHAAHKKFMPIGPKIVTYHRILYKTYFRPIFWVKTQSSF